MGNNIMRVPSTLQYTDRNFQYTKQYYSPEHNFVARKNGPQDRPTFDKTGNLAGWAAPTGSAWKTYDKYNSDFTVEPDSQGRMMQSGGRYLMPTHNVNDRGQKGYATYDETGTYGGEIFDDGRVLAERQAEWERKYPLDAGPSHVRKALRQAAKGGKTNKRIRRDPKALKRGKSRCKK